MPACLRLLRTAVVQRMSPLFLSPPSLHPSTCDATPIRNATKKAPAALFKTNTTYRRTLPSRSIHCPPQRSKREKSHTAAAPGHFPESGKAPCLCGHRPLFPIRSPLSENSSSVGSGTFEHCGCLRCWCSQLFWTFSLTAPFSSVSQSGSSREPSEVPVQWALEIDDTTTLCPRVVSQVVVKVMFGGCAVTRLPILLRRVDEGAPLGLKSDGAGGSCPHATVTSFAAC
ncbi:hypothetical protein GE09DRAFT_607001 [Coniochaeta sp. 2T2.1]|nr:hypothetical protein GE09DRAFT_607001 [Coniochaeta sp. 2T2.1]